MILLDFSGTIHAAIAINLKESGATSTDIDYLRHLILNQIKTIKTKFSDKYGELVVCLDSKNCWRREVFPLYKASRKKGRKVSELQWDLIFKDVNAIVEEFKENLPYKFVHIDNLEGDDVIAILAKHAEEIAEKNILDEMKHQVLVISNDKDLKQLQKYKYVKQYIPRTGLISKESNPEEFLQELIVKGDVCDGVPNIRSDDDTFVDESKRQKPITKKYLSEYFSLGINALSEEDKERYKRNSQLISFEYIPNKYNQQVLEEFKKPKKGTKMKMFSYFAAKGLKKLLEDISKF